MRTILATKTLLQNFSDRNIYKTLTIGTSDCNEYIPVFAIGNHDLIIFKDSDTKVMEYSMPVVSSYSYIRQYSHVLNTLQTATRPISYIFKVQGIEHKLYLHRGLIYTETGEILLALAINTEYLFSLSREDFETKDLNPHKFVLFLSPELNTPTYKNLKKKLDTLYIGEAIDLGIDIVTSSRIKNWIFKNNVKPLKFKSIAKLNKHLKEEVPMKILEM